MEGQVFNYEDVLELGFERIPQHDGVFFCQYGFDYFLMRKIITKGVIAEWDINERTVRVIRCNEAGDILGKINIESIEELKKILKFFECDGVGKAKE